MIQELKSRIEEVKKDESGFTTAELLGNAALGVLALVIIWQALGEMGERVINFIEDKMTAN